MKSILTKDLIDAAKRPNIWTSGNQVLYDLCSTNFEHQDDEIVVAKVWLIGRTYAAALERNSANGYKGDEFYSKGVTGIFKDFELDFRLKSLKEQVYLNQSVLVEAISLHYYLTGKIYKLTGHYNRSFSSKYLHFHLPELFFIYDSRVASVIGTFEKRAPKELRSLIKNNLYDKVYVNFACKCYRVKEIIRENFKEELSNREIDNLLISFAKKKVI